MEEKEGSAEVIFSPGTKFIVVSVFDSFTEADRFYEDMPKSGICSRYIIDGRTLARATDKQVVWENVFKRLANTFYEFFRAV